MSSTFNGHIPPEIEPHTAHLAGDHPRPECTFNLANKSAWPIVYKVKVQHSILSLSTVLPAHGIVPAGSSAVINLKFELQKMRELGLDLSRGHRIHVDSWYISNEDALRSDSAKLLSAIKSRVNKPRKPDTSTLRIQYVSSAGSAGPSRQGTLPSIPQTTRQPPTPRSMTTPHPYQPPPPAASLATPAINIIPPTRQQTLASNADSPTHPIAASQPTSTHEQIARYIVQSEAPTLRRTRSSSSTVADSASTRTTSSRPSIPVPARRRGDTSPTSSVAGSFISAREGNGDPDGPSGDAMEVDPPTSQLVEEPATLNTNAQPSISPSLTMRQLPFAEPTARPNPSWTAYQPPGVSSSSHLSPNRGASPESSEPDWMNYLAVDRKLVGKVKKPQGNPISCGGFSDVYKCEVRFDAPDDGNPKMVSVLLVCLRRYDCSGHD
ncbi:hypothetical protein FS837_012541 [Tulasnella sp. UAMH 9824]|nr:hypothetical protein FS837_012541 [Tulasnella sp. UAMH 9824]